MSCSWEDAYSLDNEKLAIMHDICAGKNFPIILKLAPNKTSTIELMLMIDETIANSPISFKIGFNLIPANKPRLEFSPKEFLDKKNVIWSNTISR
jgi:hypothetical protein